MADFTTAECRTLLDQFIAETGHKRFFDNDDVLTIAKQAPETLVRWHKYLIENDEELDEQTRKKYGPRFLKLALYDIHVLIDNSGSMRLDDRISVAKLAIGPTVTLDNFFTSDGVKLHLLNRSSPKRLVKTEQEFASHWESFKFFGGSQLGSALRVVWSGILAQAPLKKPSLIRVFTDGEPYGEDENDLCKSLLDCGSELKERGYNPTAIAFEIVLLSSDIKAREVWDKLVLKFQLKNHLHVIMEKSDLEIEFRKKHQRKPLDKYDLIFGGVVGAINPPRDSESGPN